MTNNKSRWCSGLLLLIVVAATGALAVATSGDLRATSGASERSQTAGSDVTGTWSGTFQSDHENVSPFTITVVISPDAGGNLIGASSLYWDCVRDPNLQVKVNGSKIELAGSDADGDSLSFRGTIDRTGTLLNLRYVASGSASGRCEIDQGAGTMGKR